MLKVNVSDGWMSDFIKTLSSDNVTICQYPCSCVRLLNPLFVIERNEKLEQLLVLKAGKSDDEHAVYVVNFEDGSEFVIECRVVTIGVGVGLNTKQM